MNILFGKISYNLFLEFYNDYVYFMFWCFEVKKEGKIQMGKNVKFCVEIKVKIIVMLSCLNGL